MTTRVEDNQTVRQLMHHKEQIITALKENGYRITNQRKYIIDAILRHDCTSCKEIYYQVNQYDPGIGIATVYRMIKTLEEIGAIDRRNMYSIEGDKILEWNSKLNLMLKSNKVIEMSLLEWKTVMEEGLRARGYLYRDEIDSVIIKKAVS